MRKIPNLQVTMQAPESGSAAASGSLKAEKSKRADHELLDVQGNVVENEEEANGIRYTLVALPERPFTYQFGQSADADKLLAMFGAKTLCTNESSAVRNSPKGEGTAEEQIDAVMERFALLQTGKWVDRTREGVGTKVDLDAYAQAIANVFISEGKLTEEQVKTEKLAAIRQKLDDDKAYARKARQHPPFAAEYAKIKGSAQVTTDDFAV